MRRSHGAAARRELHLDALLYLAFAVFAGISAFRSEFYGYRIWGALAVGAYLVGLAQALVLRFVPCGPAKGRPGRVLRDRLSPVWLVAVLGMLAPLGVLLVRRLQGVPWAEQPEVWVIERSATQLLQHGTPYLDLAALGRPPVVNDYMPYGVAMSAFGLPRALFGGSALTDARVWFGLVSIAIVLGALALLRWPSVPARAAQLALACPLTVLTFAVAGDDLPIVALIVLALALLHRRRPVWCGVVIAVAVSMKLTACPALVVIAVAVAAMLGRRALPRFGLAVLATGAVLTVPVLLVNPRNFIEQVIKFPMGMGIAHSPAASPLPGNLIARLGPAGHTAALALMLLAALALGAWLLVRPPHSAADAALRTAIGLGLAIVLAPATRYGYLVYPLALLGAAIALHTVAAPSGAEPQASTPVPAAAD